jgi:hypothetical protein
VRLVALSFHPSVADSLSSTANTAFHPQTLVLTQTPLLPAHLSTQRLADLSWLPLNDTTARSLSCPRPSPVNLQHLLFQLPTSLPSLVLTAHPRHPPSRHLATRLRSSTDLPIHTRADVVSTSFGSEPSGERECHEKKEREVSLRESERNNRAKATRGECEMLRKGGKGEGQQGRRRTSFCELESKRESARKESGKEKERTVEFRRGS